MGIFSRMSDIINSNINAMLDKAEDPEKIVRLIIQEMEDTLVEVRSAAARAIADKKELARKIAAAEREEAEWERKAELAISKGRDDLAKAALVEKAALGETATAMREQFEHVEQGLAKLNDDIGQLQAKLADAKARQKALVVRGNTATHRLQVRSRLNDERIDDALSRFEHFERKMEHVEGKVEAFDLGRKKTLHQQISELESTESIDKELAALKERLGRDRAASQKDK